MSNDERSRLIALLEGCGQAARSLKEHGDIELIARSVDVRFKGDEIKINKLKREISGSSWSVIGVAQVDATYAVLDLRREQTIEAAAMRTLMEMVLKIEEDYGVTYEGWETFIKKTKPN